MGDNDNDSLTPDRAILEKLLAHAAAAARIVGHLDGPAAGPLAEHVDAIVHELSELLGNPHLIAAPCALPAPCSEPYTRLGEALALRRCHAAPVPSADATFEHDAVTRNRVDGGAP